METVNSVPISPDVHGRIEFTIVEARALADTYLEGFRNLPAPEKPVRPLPSAPMEEKHKYTALDEAFYRDQYGKHFLAKLESTGTPDDEKDLIRLFAIDYMMGPDGELHKDEARQDQEFARYRIQEDPLSYKQARKKLADTTTDLQNVYDAGVIISNILLSFQPQFFLRNRPRLDHSVDKVCQTLLKSRHDHCKPFPHQ